MRVGVGFDIHRLKRGRRFVLGGVGIPFEKGPEGHSDGDALLHALVDALLGAAGQPDIGELFPDDSPAVKGMNSRRMLLIAVKRLHKAGFRVLNTDAVVMLEKPKFQPYKLKIRRQLALVLGIAIDQVNVKAKTMEGLGPIGRSRAVAAFCTVCLTKQKRRK